MYNNVMVKFLLYWGFFQIVLAGYQVSQGYTGDELNYRNLSTEHKSLIPNILHRKSVLNQYFVKVNHDSNIDEVTQIYSDSQIFLSSYIKRDTYIVLGSPGWYKGQGQHKKYTVQTVSPESRICKQWQYLLNHLHDPVTLDALANGIEVAELTSHLDEVQDHGLIGVPYVSKRHSNGVQSEHDVSFQIRVVFPSTHGKDTQYIKQNYFNNCKSFAQCALNAWKHALDQVCDGECSMSVQGKYGIVEVPGSYLKTVLMWLSLQPLVAQLEPMARSVLHNRSASTIIQAGVGPEASDKVELDPRRRPFWDAGLNGRGQIVGMGDSGVEIDSCYFRDDDVDIFADKTYNSEAGMYAYQSDKHRKVQLYVPMGDTADTDGHGTHVAGTIVGSLANDVRSFDPYRGMAPNAKIVVLDLGGEAIYFDERVIATPADLNENYFPIAYAQGARVHSDSWGSSSYRYDENCRSLDMFAWEHQDFLPIVAAGNYGETKFDSTVTAPAVSKNAIAVGASLSSYNTNVYIPAYKRVISMNMKVTVKLGGSSFSESHRVVEARNGGSLRTLSSKSLLVGASPRDACSDLTNSEVVKGSVVLIEKSVGCIIEDKVERAVEAGAIGVIMVNDQRQGYYLHSLASNRDINIPVGLVPLNLGNSLWEKVDSVGVVHLQMLNLEEPNVFDNVADFSSFGPTEDFRVKPDIVAPGLVKSASNEVGVCTQRTMQGTSMATPVVAGAALLVRQYFLEGFYPNGEKNSGQVHSPSGPLVKALLLGGAAPMDGFTESGLPLEPPPSFRQGFGRVHLLRSLPLKGTPMEGSTDWRLQVVDQASLKQGEQHRYCVQALGGPLSVTLVWHDYPAQYLSEKALINDLDLLVGHSELQGTYWYANGGSEPDRINNVERVYVEAMPSGQVSIRVNATTINPIVPGRQQTYSLVVLGEFHGSLFSDKNPQQALANAPSKLGQCVLITPKLTQCPKKIISTQSATFDFTSDAKNEEDVSYECKRIYTPPRERGGPKPTSQEGAWEQCKAGIQWVGMESGDYVFMVRVKGEGVTDECEFSVDVEAPITTLDDVPVESDNAVQVKTIEYSATDHSSVSQKCRLDHQPFSSILADKTVRWVGPWVTEALEVGEWMNCQSPITLLSLDPGKWVLEVVSVDAAGNEEQDNPVVKFSIRLQQGLLYTRIVKGPHGGHNSRSAVFEMNALRGTLGGGGENVTGSVEFACELKVVGSNRAVLASAQSGNVCEYADLEQNEYEFSAQTGSLGVGVEGEQRAVYRFKVDTTPPKVNVAFPPGSKDGYVQSGKLVVFNVTANEEATFKCGFGRTRSEAENLKECDDYVKSEGEGWVTVGLPNLKEGRYFLGVQGADNVGNVADMVVTPFLVDSQAPSVENMIYDKSTRKDSVTFVFDAVDGEQGSGVKSVQCRFNQVDDLEDSKRDDLDQLLGPLKECSTNHTEAVSDEQYYVMQIVLTDKAGNQVISDSYTVVVDRKPPTATIDLAPSQEGKHPTTVEFEFSTEDEAPTLGETKTECRISPVLSTKQPAEAPSTPPGSPTSISAEQSVSSADNATGTVPVQETNVGGILNGRRLRSAAHVAFPTTLVKTQQRTSTYGEWIECSSPQQYNGLKDGTFEFVVRATDEAGNVGDITPPAVFTIDQQLDVPTTIGDERAPLDMPPLALLIGGAVAIIAGVCLLAGVVMLRCRSRRQAERRRNQEFSTDPGVPPVDVWAADDDSSLWQAQRASQEDYMLQQAMKESRLYYNAQRGDQGA